MDEKDKKAATKAVKEMLIGAQAQHHAIQDILKLTSQDKTLAALAKSTSTSFKPFHKSLRDLLDKLDA